MSAYSYSDGGDVFTMSVPVQNEDEQRPSAPKEQQEQNQCCKEHGKQDCRQCCIAHGKHECSQCNPSQDTIVRAVIEDKKAPKVNTIRKDGGTTSSYHMKDLNAILQKKDSHDKKGGAKLVIPDDLKGECRTRFEQAAIIHDALEKEEMRKTLLYALLVVLQLTQYYFVYNFIIQFQRGGDVSYYPIIMIYLLNIVDMFVIQIFNYDSKTMMYFGIYQTIYLVLFAGIYIYLKPYHSERRPFDVFIFVLMFFKIFQIIISYLKKRKLESESESLGMALNPNGDTRGNNNSRSQNIQPGSNLAQPIYPQNYVQTK